MLKRSECRRFTSMKYDAEFLLDCMLLRMKSKAAYIHLRNSNLLPLPSLSTIRRLISCMPCNFGLNDFALASIQRNLQGQPKHMLFGSLVWDEMAISEDLTFNGQALRFEGFCDYGEGVITTEQNSQQMADHALVFIFRPYRFSWIQPMAVFATKGAACGDMIFDLALKAIIALHHAGAIVKSVVCDGAAPNKKAMKLFKVSETLIDPTHSFQHPIHSDVVYFFIDVPHIYKSIRNNMMTHHNVQVLIRIFIRRLICDQTCSCFLFFFKTILVKYANELFFSSGDFILIMVFFKSCLTLIELYASHLLLE
jgi:hypothetical protein